jgi:hypothetical protein
MNKRVAGLAVTAALGLSLLSDLPQSPAHSSPAAASACNTPREYVRLINDGKYDSVGSLFADNAVYMGPDGKTRHGSKEVGAFYSSFLPRLKPRLRASRFFQEDNECMMELENKSNPNGEFAPTAVDHFTVDAGGKISRFIVYLRPGAESTRLLRRALSTR